jgi:hypothetical protein
MAASASCRVLRLRRVGRGGGGCAAQILPLAADCSFVFRSAHAGDVGGDAQADRCCGVHFPVRSFEGSADHCQSCARERCESLITLCPSQTPLAELSTVNLAIDVHEDTEIYTPLTSRIAHLVVIDVLAMGVAMARGPSLVNHLKSVKRSLRSLRLSPKVDQIPRGLSGSPPAGDSACSRWTAKQAQNSGPLRAPAGASSLLHRIERQVSSACNIQAPPSSVAPLCTPAHAMGDRICLGTTMNAAQRRQNPSSAGRPAPHGVPARDRNPSKLRR